MAFQTMNLPRCYNVKEIQGLQIFYAEILYVFISAWPLLEIRNGSMKTGTTQRIVNQISIITH